MRFILPAAAAHAAFAGYLTAHRAWLYLAAGVPNPPAQAPPGLSLAAVASAIVGVFL